MGQPVQGLVNQGVTDAETGNAPVKVGARYNTTPPTVTDGQIVDAQAGTRGSINVTLYQKDAASAFVASTAGGDAVTGSGIMPAALWEWNGASFDRVRTANTFKIVAAVAITAGTGATIWTPAAGKKFRVLGYTFSASAAASLILCDNVVGTPVFRGPLLAAAGIDNQYNIGNGILSAAANNVLKLDVSANATVTGTVWGTEE